MFILELGILLEILLEFWDSFGERMPKFKDNKLDNRNAKIVEEKYQYLVNNLSDIVMESELNGNFTYVSHQVYDILGYYPDE